jgi:hypothetical protein
VLDFARTFHGSLVTTRWILVEVANAVGGSPVRMAAARMLQRVEEDPNFRVIAGSDGLYERGLALFVNRPDKDWLLTDCISIVVMADERLADALTGDRHFEQAGFKALLV